MRLNGRQRLQREPHFKDFSKWPHIDVFDLPTKKRKAFLRNRKLMMLVLSGVAHVVAAKRCGVHPSFVSYLLNRCLAGPIDREPALTAGLVPSSKINKCSRSRPLSVNGNCGAQGAFQAILSEHPDIKEKLDKIILAFIRRDRRAENLRPGRFHREFLRLLREKNWPTNQYPFDRDRFASETCRKYFHQRVEELRLPTRIKKAERIVTPKSKYAYEEVQIDAWLVDLTTSMEIELDERMIPIRLSRFTVYLASDAATGCRLSYHIALTAHPSKEDVLAVIEKIHLPSKRVITTNGVDYLPGAAFPSQLGKAYEHAGIQMIRLDNALAHHAGAIREYVCETLGATLNLGIPGQPKARGAVEYVFKQLAELAIRFPSATGNHPTHPMKESAKNAKLPPITKLHEFEDILDVTLASYNVTNRQLSGSSTPLELLRYQMEHCYLPLCFSGVGSKRSAFIETKVRSVKFLKNEQRHPFINFQTLRYNGACLSSPTLLNKKIIIEYDVRDIRTIRAYQLDGRFLGELEAPMTRQHFPLSIQTFRKLRKRSANASGNVASTVDGYFVELAEGTQSPKSNLELVRVARELLQAGLTKIGVSKRRTKQVDQPIVSNSNNIRKIASWAERVNKKRKAS